MPFKSEAQRRLFHAMADRGEISEEKVREWEHKTKNKEKLPYHKKQGSEAALASFGVKVAEMPHWALPVAKHVAAGAIPAAALAYMASGKDPETGEDHSLRNALLAGTVGGLGGAGVDALKRVSAREAAQNTLLLKALEEGKWKPKRLTGLAGGRPSPETMVDRARAALSEKMPLYATPEEWEATKIRKGELKRPLLRPGEYQFLEGALRND